VEESVHDVCPAPRAGKSQADNQEKESDPMANEDTVKGEIKQAEGKAQGVAGDVTDDHSTEAAGKLKQAEGKVQETFGKAKDAVKDALDKHDA